MPAQKPGRSEQSVGTDPQLVEAVISRFGPLAIDLAASPENTLVPHLYFTEADDSLKQGWGLIGGNRWLNPPFSNITPWAAKCAATAGHALSRTLFLVPASIGSNWFANHVHGKALVLALNPRLTFVGHKNPYPRDTVLCIYGETPGFDVWHWKERRT